MSSTEIEKGDKVRIIQRKTSAGGLVHEQTWTGIVEEAYEGYRESYVRMVGGGDFDRLYSDYHFVILEKAPKPKRIPVKGEIWKTGDNFEYLVIDESTVAAINDNRLTGPGNRIFNWNLQKDTSTWTFVR